jgi:DNA-binding response OmpR family regulator
MNEIQQGRDVLLPVVFLSAHDEFEARLEAVRVGSIAYSSKPVNIGNQIDKLDNLTSTTPLAPYRAMIVDDSVAPTAYHTAVLEQAGMAVKAVNNSFNVVGALLEFTPDLILIDLYMPEYSGTYLAKVIRQLDAFVSIPIVFLSAENDLDKQLFAMDLGRRFPYQTDTAATSGFFHDQPHPAITHAAFLHGALQPDRLAQPHRHQRSAGW